MQHLDRAVLNRPGSENPAASQQGTQILDRHKPHSPETQSILKISGKSVRELDDTKVICHTSPAPVSHTWR